MQASDWSCNLIQGTIILYYLWQDSLQESSLVIISGITYVFLLQNVGLRCTELQNINHDIIMNIR